MGNEHLRALCVLVAIASVTLSPALAWTSAAMGRPAASAGASPPAARHTAPERLVPTALAEPVAITATSVVLDLDQALILIDPVGNQQQYSRYGRPDIVVLTSPDPAHLSVDTMIGLLRRDTLVLAPQSVIDRLPLMISNNTVAPFEIGTGQTARGITFRALSPASTPPAGARVHDRDRGDIRVLIEVDGRSLYF